MVLRVFTIEYEFVSARAYGPNSTCTRTVKASDAKDAIACAGAIGFREFGNRFTENCIDWRIAA